jgi:hypothetical protein
MCEGDKSLLLSSFMPEEFAQSNGANEILVNRNCNFWNLEWEGFSH